MTRLSYFTPTNKAIAKINKHRFRKMIYALRRVRFAGITKKSKRGFAKTPTPILKNEYKSKIVRIRRSVKIS